MNKSADMTQDWPSESDNAELVCLADELTGAAPRLSAEAMTRVGEQMYAEFDRIDNRQRWRRAAFGFSIAAAILLAIAGFAYFRAGREVVQPLPNLAKKIDAPTPVMIEDRVTIAVSEGTPTPGTEKSLVRLEEYRSLFSD